MTGHARGGHFFSYLPSFSRTRTDSFFMNTCIIKNGFLYFLPKEEHLRTPLPPPPILQVKKILYSVEIRKYNFTSVQLEAVHKGIYKLIIYSRIFS